VEAVSLQAEMLDLRTDASAPAAAICLESRVDRSLGSVSTVVVRVGTLRVGDHVVYQSSALHGELYGHVRSLLGSGGEVLREAGPGVAVGVVGIKGNVPPGAEFCVVKNEKEARALSQRMIVRNTGALTTVQMADALIAEREAAELKIKEGEAVGQVGTEMEAVGDETEAEGQGEEGEEKVHSIVVLVKGDVQGSADAVAQCVQALETVHFPIRILKAGVGDVTEMDVKIASATHKVKGNMDEAIIVAFNVRVKEAAKRMARKSGVDVVSHSLIYHLEEELKTKIKRKEEGQKQVVEVLGKASVIRVFEDGAIGGCSVQEGTLSKGDSARVLRVPDASSGSSVREEVFSGVVDSIKHFAKDVRSVTRGSECGISVEGWKDFTAGDVVECVFVRKPGEGSSK